MLDYNAIMLTFGTALAKSLAIIAMVLIGLRIGDSLIEKVFLKVPAVPGMKVDDNRKKTLLGLLKNALKYVAWTVAVLMILPLFGIDIKALLGGVAILGLAVGFGAQNLVRDVITGFFIVYERQYDVGDYVIMAGVSGVVEEIGLRTTRLRDWSGEVHIVPNGLVEKTTNRSRANSRAIARICIAYHEDINRAINVLQEACDEIRKTNESIVDGPRILGVGDLGDKGVELMAWARTKPLEQWGVERELRLKLKQALDKAGIEIPYPRMVVYHRERERNEKHQSSITG